MWEERGIDTKAGGKKVRSRDWKIIPKMEKQDIQEPASKAEEDKHGEGKKEEVKKYEEGMSISQFVKKEWTDELMAMGFSKAVSEKALYLTGNTGTEKAIEYIEQHQKDPDYEEELRIVGWVRG